MFLIFSESNMLENTVTNNFLQFADDKKLVDFKTKSM